MHFAASLLLIAAAVAASAAVVLHSDAGRRDRVVIAVTALALRLVALLVVSTGSALTRRRFVLPDETTYLSEGALGGGFSAWYSNLLSSIFRLTGPSAWLPRVLNVVAGVLLALVVYELVHILADRRPAVLSGLAVAVWPSLVVWSALALKDSFTLLAIFTVLLGAAMALKDRQLGLVLIVLGALGVGKLRPYAYVALCAPLVVTVSAGSVLAAYRRRGLAPIAVLWAGVLSAGLAGMPLGHGFLGTGFVQDQFSVERVDFTRTEGAAGETGFAKPAGSRLEVIAGIPEGLLFTLLGPFPWQSGAESRLLLLVELPLWYGVLGAAAAGVWRRRWRLDALAWAPMALFGLAALVVVATYIGNAGTAMRQRAMILPIVFALASLWFSDASVARGGRLTRLLGKLGSTSVVTGLRLPSDSPAGPGAS